MKSVRDQVCGEIMPGYDQIRIDVSDQVWELVTARLWNKTSYEVWLDIWMPMFVSKS